MSPPFVDAHTHKLSSADQKLSLYHLSLEEILAFQISKESFWALGLHPWWLSQLSLHEREQCWQAIEKLAPMAHAIGECGLDRSGKAGDFEIQKTWFKRHQTLYPEKSLVIHNVRAGSDLLELVASTDQRNILLHDYQGGIEETKQWLKRQTYFSFGSSLVRADRGVAVKAIDSLKLIPLNRLLLETDDSALPIERLYELAHFYLNGPSMDELKSQLSINFHDFLGVKL